LRIWGIGGTGITQLVNNGEHNAKWKELL